MKADAHQQNAQDYEHAITILGDPVADPKVALSLIENYWQAAFHWVAYGCQRKYGQHKENHTQLGRYLRDLGEPDIATRWDAVDRTRRNAMYARKAGSDSVTNAHDDWEAIRLWATS